jgi:hypothetical protein
MEAQVLYTTYTLWQDDFIVCRQNEKIVKRETCDLASLDDIECSACEMSRGRITYICPHRDEISKKRTYISVI